MAIVTNPNLVIGGLYPGVRSVHQDYSAQPVTGTLVETTLKSIVIPAGHGLTSGCKIIITTLFQAGANNGNAKTARIKIGSTSFAGFSVASTIVVTRKVEIYIIDITNSQLVLATSSQQGFGTSSAVPATAALDLSGAFTISTSGTLGDITDTLTDKIFDVDFRYAA